MSVMEIIGLVLWLLVIIFGKVTINNCEGSDPLARIVVMLVAFPIVGILFTVVGLLGLVMLSPLLHLFGLNWFLKVNF